MANKTVNYKCPSCGGPLHFDSASGKLKCDYCLSVYKPDEIAEMYGDKGKGKQQVEFDQEAEADVMSRKEDEITVGGKWDASTIPADWGEDSANMVAYSCPSCGGEILAEASTAATSCPYCGNPTIIESKLSGSMRPQYIIPFKLDQKAAAAAYQKFCKKRVLLPKTFSSNSTIEKLRGIYVPFWLFDSNVSGDYSFLGENSSTHREGDYIVTRRSQFSIRRSVDVGFRFIPTDASRNMPDDLMDIVPGGLRVTENPREQPRLDSGYMRPDEHHIIFPKRGKHFHGKVFLLGFNAVLLVALKVSVHIGIERRLCLLPVEEDANRPRLAVHGIAVVNRRYYICLAHCPCPFSYLFFPTFRL